MRTSKLFTIWFLSGYLLTSNILQLSEYNALGVDPLKLDKQQLLTFLQGDCEQKCVLTACRYVCVRVLGVLSFSFVTT